MVKNINVKTPASYPIYGKDVTQIVSATNAHGYSCSEEQAETLWSLHSDSMDAGWLYLPSTEEEIVLTIRPFFEEEDKR